jgi:peptidoglycan biosynthesis protein MviN/MurJ (putative lipid II flippase)
MITIDQTINGLSVLVLIGFLIALIYLIALLYRANRLLDKLDHLSVSFKSFVEDLVPAIVNVGTIARAVEVILHNLQPHPSHRLTHKEKK